MTVKLNISETAVPTDLPRGGKTKEPNPYLSHVETLKANLRTEDSDGKALTFTIPRDKDANDKSFSKTVKGVVAKWQEAGAELGITVRALVEKNDADAPTGKVTVWGVPRITRKRKSADADSASA